MSISKFNGIAIDNVSTIMGVAGCAKVLGQTVQAGGQTYYVHQGFETATTGYDHGETWYADSGTNPVFSTSGLGMVGSQCLELDSTSGNSGTNGYQLWTAMSPAYSTFLWRCTALPPIVSQIAQLRLGFDVRAVLEVLANGTVDVRSTSGTTAITVGTVAANTTYRIWFEATKSTGSNGTVVVYFSTNNTKPSSGNNVATSTGGTYTDNFDTIYLINDNITGGQKFYFDEIRVSPTVIGSNPP